MKPITEKAGRLLPTSVLTALALALASPAAAGVWDENYTKGQNAFVHGDWDNAIKYFNIAVKDKPNSAAQYPLANMSVIDYFPYYYLGQAYLYSGNYRLAKGNFHKELSFGAINGAPPKRHLERLLDITDQLLKMTEASSLPAADAELENHFRHLQNLLAASNYREAETLFSEIKNRGVEDKRIPIYEAWIKQRPAPPTPTEKSEIEPTNTAQEFFEQGLDYYLRDQYEPALRSFQSAFASDPKFTLAKSWISKTQAEIQRLSSENKTSDEPASVITKTDTATTAPIIFATVPNKTSRQNLIIEGEARDDMGVDFIQVVLNGASLKDAEGQDVVIRPGANDPKRFSFTLTLPLQMGKNQLTLIAYDIDSSAPGFERRAILRVKPFYQTSSFAIALAAVILLGVGAVVITKRVKYRLAIVNKYNPYIAGSPIRNEEMFFGREKLIKRVLNTIHNNSLLLYGPRRIGKTSLQHQLQHRLQNLNDPEFHFVPVLIDLQGTTEERFFITLMEEILETCKADLEGAAAFQLHQDGGQGYSSRDFSQDLKNVLQILSAKTPKKLKLVLLIDEVDELNKYSEQVNQKLRSVFMKTCAENLVAVMSGISIKKHWQSEGSPWYNFFEEIEVPPFDCEDAINLIRRPVAGIFAYDDRAVEKIIEYSECKPFIIQKFCVNVIQRIIELKRRWVTVEDVEAVRAQVLREEAVEDYAAADRSAQ
jgi:hypothetical protein